MTKYLFALIVISFCAYGLDNNVRSYAKDRYKDLQLFTKVLNLVQKYYVEEVDTSKLIQGGLKGMLKELDPHTNFLPQDIYKEFESETSGKFGGIGIEITIQKGILTVISPIEDTPAWKAGVKAGDKIVRINGESTKGLSLVEAAQLMRGDNGSKINLGIYREGFDEPKDFIIKRGDVKIKSIKYTDLDEGFGYVKVTSFIENTYSDLDSSLNALAKKHKAIKGLVVDLRSNPGGLLDQAIKISDMFLSEGLIVSTKGRNDSDFFYAKKDGTYDQFPIVVLIDEYSASASEILAGALQDNKRALIMGQRSFGKGSVQSIVPLGDDSGALKLTVARYFTPSGRSIQAEGVVPDVEVEKFDTDLLRKAKIKQKVRRERDMKNHLLSKKERSAKEKKKDNSAFDLWWLAEQSEEKKNQTPKEKLISGDYQIAQAYNYLKAWKTMQGSSLKR